MIGRADIEGSKSYVAMNAWQPQASYPCGNRFLLSREWGSLMISSEFACDLNSFLRLTEGKLLSEAGRFERAA